MKGFCRNDIICGIHLQRIKPKVSAAVCQWFFCGTTADMTPLTTWKKENWCMDSGAFFVQRSAVTVLSPRYFVAGVSSFLTKIPPVFRTGNQAASGTDLPFWNYSVRKYEISGSHWVVQRIRRCLLGLREVRDENKIFVTRAWRRFCWMTSIHTFAISISWRKSPLFSLGRSEGMWLGIGLWDLLCLALAFVFHTLSVCGISEWSSFGKVILLGSVGLPLPLLREYVRCHIKMTVLFVAHHSSICLSLLYADFGCPMDMTDSHIENDSAHSHFDMIILKDF